MGSSLQSSQRSHSLLAAALVEFVADGLFKVVLNSCEMGVSAWKLIVLVLVAVAVALVAVVVVKVVLLMPVVLVFLAAVQLEGVDLYQRLSTGRDVCSSSRNSGR